MTSFIFKPAARIRGNHDAMLSELQDLYSGHGQLVPEAVVERARPADNPLHEHFEWDDAEAAHQFRLQQAGHLIRAVVVLDSEEGPSKPPVRAFVNVNINDENEPEQRVYKALDEVLADTDLRHQALQSALQELAAFRKRYRDLQELAEVFAAADRAAELVGREAS